MRPRRSEPTKLVRLGTDTIEQLRKKYPGKSLDWCVKWLLFVTNRPVDSEQSVNRISAQ